MCGEKMEFRGKNVLVTGGQQGIGLSMARAFVKKGANVAVNWFDNKIAAEKIILLGEQYGVGVKLIQGDIANVADARHIVDKTITRFGAIDILINNAGVFPRVPFLSMEEHDWDHVLDVNLKGSFFCSQAAVKFMIEYKCCGSIINLSSQAIRGYAPNSVHYTASKMGVVGLTRAMALDLAKYGIRVNCIAPGLTDTAQPRYGNSEDEIKELVKEVPLGRLIKPDEISNLALFLCSDQAKMITGQTYHVNGGTYLPG